MGPAAATALEIDSVIKGNAKSAHAMTVIIWYSDWLSTVLLLLTEIFLDPVIEGKIVIILVTTGSSRCTYPVEFQSNVCALGLDAVLTIVYEYYGELGGHVCSHSSLNELISSHVLPLLHVS